MDSKSKRIKRETQTTFTRHGVHYDFEPECFEGYPLIKEIGEGAYGNVFLTFKTKNGEESQKQYALKLIPLDVSIPGPYCQIQLDNCIKQTTKEFLEELRISRWMGEENVGPKVIAGGICKQVKNIHQGNINVGYIIQEYWPMTLSAYVKNNLNNFRENFDEISEILQHRAQRLDELGLDHDDLHDENILVSVDSDEKVVDGVFIDFNSLIKRGTVLPVLKNYNSANLKQIMRILK